ncbi:hypothetical protein DL98DRAFT_71805 [Cadophora sp. DSE1049]|nr:hypothetical protein DL98DRAFT_71805 [Cadophora sp. DSE1049]
MSSVDAIASATPPIVTRGENQELTFTLFSKLPLELRCMVWRFALPPPKVVKISRDLSDGRSASSSVLGLFTRRGNPRPSSSVNCSLLSVNNESRELALSVYRLDFGNRLARPTYFDCISDSLYFPDNWVLIEFLYPLTQNKYIKSNQDENTKIKHVVLGVPWGEFSIVGLVSLIKRFVNLKTLTLTVESEHEAPYSQFDGYGSKVSLATRLEIFRKGCSGNKIWNGEGVTIASMGLDEVRKMVQLGAKDL